MKSNKTVMMAALIAGGLFATGLSLRAQDSTNPPPGGARPPVMRFHSQLDAIAARLGLSDDQKTKAKPVFEEMQQKLSDLRKDTTMDVVSRRAKLMEIRNDTTARLKDILNPRQFEQWQRMMPASRRLPGPAATPPAAVTNTPAAGDARPPQ